MLDYDTHARLADATAELMRSSAVAAAQTLTASACRGLTLWSDMLRSPPPRRPAARSASGAVANPFEAFWRFSPGNWVTNANSWPHSAWLPGYASSPAAWGGAPYAWPAFGDWTQWSRLYWPGWHAQPAQTGPFSIPETVTQAALRVALPSTYASYRSAGGHAVAQVMVPSADAIVAAGLTATAAFTQMHTLFGVWRTMLGA
jgi:hypothetical protein